MNEGTKQQRNDRYLNIGFVGEGVVVSDGSQEHLYADDEVL